MTTKDFKIILASQSPRRKELMTLMGLKFECMPSNKEEDMSQKLSIKKLSQSLAKQKAVDIFNSTNGNRVVIGSDCMVYLKNKVFGKPKDDKEAFSMLKTLSNKWHKVITSLCVLIEKDGQTKQYLTSDITKVKFMKLDDNMIHDYLKTGEHKDKAGSYAIQGKSGMFIEKINGNMATVIGLPTCKLFKILRKENLM